MLGKPSIRTGFIAFPMSVLQECNTFDRHFSNSNRINDLTNSLLLVNPFTAKGEFD